MTLADMSMAGIIDATHPLYAVAIIAPGDGEWPDGDGEWEVRVDRDGVAWTMWDEVPF